MPDMFRADSADELTAAFSLASVPADAAGFFIGPLLFLGAWTNEDLQVRRRFEAIETRPMPITLFDQPLNAGHRDAIAVGAIARIWETPGPGGITVINGIGWFAGTPAGQEAINALRSGTRPNISADTYFNEVHTSYEDTTSTHTYDFLIWDEATGEITEITETANLRRYLYNVASATVYGATQLAVAGAFAGAHSPELISLAQFEAWMTADLKDVPVITDSTLPNMVGEVAASTGETIELPLDPPVEVLHRPEAEKLTHFPQFDGPYIFGHLCGWNQCHRGKAGCVRPPRGAGLGTFHRTPRPVEGGTELAGPVTMRTRHARLASEPTLQDRIHHLENSGAVIAEIRVVEGKHGLWACGVLRGGASPADIEEFALSHPSPEWRRDRNGQWQLEGVLMVNDPAYLIISDDGREVVGSAEGQACGCDGKCGQRSADAGDANATDDPADDVEEVASVEDADHNAKILNEIKGIAQLANGI